MFSTQNISKKYPESRYGSPTLKTYMYIKLMASKYKIGSVQHPVKCKAFSDGYNVKRIKVILSSKKHVLWNESFDNRENPFIKFIPLFSDKTATALKSSALAVHFVHAMLLDFRPSLDAG